MAKIVKETIHAKGIDIGIYTTNFENEFISLTDIAKYRNEDDPRFVIQNRMGNRNTVEFLGVWEELHNPDFNRVQFEAVKNEAGLNRFVMTPTKWITQMNAIGIVSKAGRYGGTYAHSRIGYEKRKNEKLRALQTLREDTKLRIVIALPGAKNFNNAGKYDSNRYTEESIKNELDKIESLIDTRQYLPKDVEIYLL